MNNTTQAFIEYASQFVITDLTILVLVIGLLVVGVLIIGWYCGLFRTI